MTVTFTDGTTSGVVTKDLIPAMGVKMLQVKVPSGFVWATDELVIDLKKYGARYLSGFLAFEDYTTAGSVVIAATGTTSVASGVLTIDSVGSDAHTVSGTFILFVYWLKK